mmetsp:Transcript_36757/g.92840  ORF Transcript_36757/g.92840 Transcript_36757/m.92840 type:complete len:213 (+) Transcript_36757:1613-2251(+)
MQELKDAPNGPGGGVLDVWVWVLDCLQQVAQCLLDGIDEQLGLRPVQDEAKCKGGCLTQAPVLWRGVLADIFLDEWHDHGHDVILHHAGCKAQAGAGCNGDVPGGVILLLALLLLGEQLQQVRHQVWCCCLDEVVRGEVRVLLCQPVILLLCNGAPELQSLQAHILLVLPDCLDCDVVDLSHVGHQLGIVQGSNLVQALERGHTDADLRGLP